jgi:hypothetical protein
MNGIHSSNELRGKAIRLSRRRNERGLLLRIKKDEVADEFDDQQEG